MRCTFKLGRASVQSYKNSTPFDAVIGNASCNLAHSVMPSSIANSLVLEFDKSRDAYLERKLAAYAAVFQVKVSIS